MSNQDQPTLGPDSRGSGIRALVVLALIALVAGGMYLGFREPEYGETNQWAWLGPTLIVASVCGVAGGIIGANKRMGSSAGWWWGFLLGPLGVIIVALAERAAGATQYGPTALPPAPGTPAGWLADPRGTFVHRYWDGGRWTEHVHDGTSQSVDPI